MWLCYAGDFPYYIKDFILVIILANLARIMRVFDYKVTIFADYSFGFRDFG